MDPTKVKILIAEDESFIADLYSHVLTKAGYTIKTANNGLTALNMLQQEQFNLILLDIMMPGMNGLEVLREWKIKNPQSPMIVILLTNLGQDSVIKEGFDLGAQGYLIKSSMTPDQVAVEVGNALKSSTQPPVTPSPGQPPVVEAPSPILSPLDPPTAQTPPPTLTILTPPPMTPTPHPSSDTLAPSSNPPTDAPLAPIIPDPTTSNNS